MHLSFFDKCLLWIVLSQSVARFVSTAVVCWAFTCVPYCHEPERAMMKVATLAFFMLPIMESSYPININVYVRYAMQRVALVQIVQGFTVNL
jgi:hypothetical protein